MCVAQNSVQFGWNLRTQTIILRKCIDDHFFPSSTMRDCYRLFHSRPCMLVIWYYKEKIICKEIADILNRTEMKCGAGIAKPSFYWDAGFIVFWMDYVNEAPDGIFIWRQLQHTHTHTFPIASDFTASILRWRMGMWFPLHVHDDRMYGKNLQWREDANKKKSNDFKRTVIGRKIIENK